jgi:hypothetical protein
MNMNDCEFQVLQVISMKMAGCLLAYCAVQSDKILTDTSEELTASTIRVMRPSTSKVCTKYGLCRVL